MSVKTSSIVLICFIALMTTACEQQGPDFGALGSSGDSELFRLAHRNGCLECHSIGATTIGPSWNAISERYKDVPMDAARDHLANSVRNGSQGQWFTMKGAAGMPPLKGRVADDHIVQLVEYILNLKRKSVDS